MASADLTPEDELAVGMPSEDATTASTTSVVEGVVVAIAHGFFEVSSGGATYLCMLRGKLRKSRPAPPPRRPAPAASRWPRTGRPERAQAEPVAADTRIRIAPGDRVLLRSLGGGQGVIEDVLARRTALSRARSEAGGEHVMLANLDHAALVFAVREPVPHFGMLDRYLALCEHAHVDVTICLNKLDLGVPDDVESVAQVYAGLGYRLLYTSATSGDGVEALRERLAGRISLLTGPSGVGKSSLMNDLIPDAGQRVGEISEATGKGRHTTTGVRLLPFPGGGWLADSAGIRELALWNVPPDELPSTFRELRPYVGNCHYDDCDHSEAAEGCALRQALADGKITPERFASFERLLNEAREAEAPAWES